MRTFSVAKPAVNTSTTAGDVETEGSQLTISLAVAIPLVCIGGVVVVIATCVMRRRKQKSKQVKIYW